MARTAGRCEFLQSLLDARKPGKVNPDRFLYFSIFYTHSALYLYRTIFRVSISHLGQCQAVPTMELSCQGSLLPLRRVSGWLKVMAWRVARPIQLCSLAMSNVPSGRGTSRRPKRL